MASENGKKILYWAIRVLITVILALYGAWMTFITNQTLALSWRLSSIESSVASYTKQIDQLVGDNREIWKYMVKKGWKPKKKDPSDDSENP